MTRLVENPDAGDPLFDAGEAFASVSPDYDLLIRMQEEGWLPEEDDVDPGAIYNGRKVRWVGTEGRMMKLDWDQIHAAPGNPFEPGKVLAFAELIGSGDKPLINAPPVLLSDVTLDDVEESLHALAREELFASHGMTRPFTAGDEELDEYIANPDDYIETYAADDDDADTIRADMTERADEAVEQNLGDLGKITAQLRDGNHRAYGAYLAGEPDLWVIVRGASDMKRLGLTEDDLE